jgi:predicted alpha/beta superfamily hydrolase
MAGGAAGGAAGGSAGGMAGGAAGGSAGGAAGGRAGGSAGGAAGGTAGGAAGGSAGGTAGGGTGGGAAAVTTIYVHYPAGTKTVWLRGSDTSLSWFSNTTMTHGPNDTWSVAVTTTASSFEVKPMLDAAWSIGPNYKVNGGQTVDIYPRFVNYNGRVTKLFNAFHSQYLMPDRGVWAYFPASYDENTTARFPVLYMHDGQNLFDANAPYGGWKVDQTLNAAAQDASIREMIVIGIESTADRITEYTGGPAPGAGGDNYRSLIINELKPQVDSMLRTLPGRATTGIMGSSMGGHISAYISATRPDIFGMDGNISTTVFGVLLSTIGSISGTQRPRVYVDTGTVSDNPIDGLYAAYLNVGYVDGVDLKKVVQQGASHNESYWAQRLPGALQFLFGPR